jgi:hypothetical protein
MAKIPRIDLGDRPSGIPAPIPLDTTTSDIIGSVTATSAAAMGVATGAAIREQKRLAEAMEAKQRIVDASDVGQLTTRFESNIYKLEDELHKEFAQNPAAAVDEYMKRAREILPQNVEAAPNDRVKLGATQGNESTISSGVARMHNWVSSRQTQRVKGNTELAMTAAINDAAYMGSADAVGAYRDRIIAKLTPEAEMSYGAEAGEKMKKLSSAIIKRYSAYAAKHEPQQFLFDARNSDVIKGEGGLDGEDHAMMVAHAESAYANLNDTRNLEIASEAFSSGEVLAAGLGTDEFIPAASARMTKLVDESKNLGVGFDANGRKLLPADAAKQKAKVDVQIKRLSKLQAMSYKQLDAKAIDDVDTINILTLEHNKLFDAIKEGSVSDNLEGLLSFQDRIEAARDEKKITKAKYDAFKGSITDAHNGVMGKQEGQWGWTSFLSDERAGTKELNRQFKNTYASFPIEVQSAARVAYLREFKNASKQGKMNAAKAIHIAQQVISRETGKVIPGAFD